MAQVTHVAVVEVAQIGIHVREVGLDLVPAAAGAGRVRPLERHDLLEQHLRLAQLRRALVA